MRILICIDDTDNLESKGTGAHALNISDEILKNQWGIPKFISRHQLYVHNDIPYTSHNSAMCFEVDVLQSEDLANIGEFCKTYLKEQSAAGSDPGLCIVVPDSLENKEELIQFGKKAKETVLTKKDAYETAERLGVHLSEHGGTGGGVIGALAGAGLRLSGNDGRIKGKYFIECQNEVVTVKEILCRTNIQEIREENGGTLGEDEKILLGEKVKGVLLEGKIVLLVERIGSVSSGEAKWQTLPKTKIKKY
ncbi:MAG: hypothetical protein HPY74_19375 [Firmicutes bacterium]|nr:hypothetical protein [Bacillota bacterium]